MIQGKGNDNIVVRNLDLSILFLEKVKMYIILSLG